MSSSLPLTVMPIFGTRPEAVKMSPLVRHLLSRPDEFRVHTVVTGQHREMLDQILRGFEISPDRDLDIMQPGQTLTDITARVLAGVEQVLTDINPQIVLVQGDTTTVMSAALCAFYHQVAVGHVEAGLRTGDRYDPFPEEMNRRLTGSLATLHFAPTTQARDNLLRENVAADSIYVTGNTVIDALLTVAPEPEQRSRRLLLVTAHRRENWGQPLRNICLALREIVRGDEDVEVVFAMHRNPVVREVVRGVLDNEPRVDLVEPPDYFDFIRLMSESCLLLTDSGGVQEEAPALGKPVLVLRRTTERPEGVAAGTARLVGIETDDIVHETRRLLRDSEAYAAMSRAVNPYGDGRSCRRIADAILHHFDPARPRPADFEVEGGSREAQA